MFPNSSGSKHVPHKTFASVGAQDHQRLEMMRDRGIHYNPNGGGRDTYIYNDNGGFADMKKPREQFHPAT